MENIYTRCHKCIPQACILKLYCVFYNSTGHLFSHENVFLFCYNGGKKPFQ